MKKLRLGLFISRRLLKERRDGTSFSRPINVIAIIGIALGLAVMILAVAILTGFKAEIRNKIAGFAGHIQVVNFDSNYSYETIPISASQPFIEKLMNDKRFSHMQVFATKAGIIKTDENIQGVVLKGVGQDYDWSFFRKSLVEGDIPELNDSVRSNEVVISRKISDMLDLKLNDRFAMYFIQDPPRSRMFTIKGIYETGVEEMDKTFVLCDIAQIRRLNGWEPDQVSGIEILVSNFSKLDQLSFVVRDAIGYRVSEDDDQMKVTNIHIKYPQIFDWLNFQDTNVIVILVLMLIVAGFNMVSGLLILILEKTNMIGILKALGSGDRTIRRVFLYQSAYLISTGLFWGNIIGIGMALLQLKTGIISLDASSYYLSTVPINLNILHILALNIGTMLVIILMLIIPSQLISRISPVRSIRFN